MAEETLISQRGSGDLIPRPDPTVLTATAVREATAAMRRELDQAITEIRRELESVRALLASRFDSHIRESDRRFAEVPGQRKEDVDSLRDLLQTRLTALEAKLRLGFEEVKAIPAETRAEINHLRELHEGRFTGIEQQFTERDIRADQDKRASKDALDAALLAQKEAVAQQNDANTTAATKSETSFTKQIDQIGTLIATLEKSLTDRITELKERIDRGEGSSSGAFETRTERRLDAGLNYTALAVLISAVILAITLYASLHHP
jgi:hypothetical protein